MILGVDPEHRDRRDAVLAAYPLREPNRGQRLQQREEWSAEETGLLTGDDGDGLRIAKSGRRRDAAGWRAAPALLRLQQRRRCRRDRGDAGCARAMASRQAAGSSGLPAKNGATRAIVEDVVGGEPPDPRKAPDVDGKHGPLSLKRRTAGDGPMPTATRRRPVTPESLRRVDPVQTLADVVLRRRPADVTIARPHERTSRT